MTDNYLWKLAKRKKFLSKQKPKKKIKNVKKAKKKKLPQKKQDKFYQSWEWKEVRYRVLLRDGRQCICCGAKAPEVKIVVDHIKPRRKFPELELNEGNLQCLCDSCNRGKSNKDYTDFRILEMENQEIEDSYTWRF